MRLLLSILLLVFQTYTGFLVKANPIDSLKTKKSVENFIMNNFPEFKSGYTISDEIYPDKLDSSLLIPLSYKGWDIIDFDKNGLNDLIVNGYDSNGENNYLIILAINDATFIKKSLPHSFDSEHYKGYYLSDIPVIFVAKSYFYNDSTSVDTLVYKYGNFIEYNKTPKNYDISELNYYTSVPGMGGYNYTAYINFKSYQSHASHDIWGKDQAVSIIDKSTIEVIKNILNYIDFNRLSNYYELDVTDMNTIVIEIIYDNGEKKIITDYGQWGTYGLYAIYNLLENLNWTKLK